MERIEFTKEMKKNYTILFPNMLDIHFRILQKIFVRNGYNIELLTNTDSSVINEGLRYVHNDTCYPALLTIGQMISALKSGKYDVEKTALIMTQTGGGCRASNYIHLLRKGLANAGLSQVPVISLNLSGLEKNSGFKISLSLLRQGLAAIVYGDLLMLLKNQIQPYEKNKGETMQMVIKWVDYICEIFLDKKGVSGRDIAKYSKEIVADFEKIEVLDIKKVRVGVVGEIYVKYSALANNNLEQFLESQDCEVMVPGLIGFMIFKCDNRLEDIKLYGGNGVKKAVVEKAMKFFLSFEKHVLGALQGSRFISPTPYYHLKELVEPVIGYGCKMGEGWLLTAEILELIEQGYGNVVCAQPFGCLPNHIVGKGMIRKIRTLYKDANIVSIDYDPSATKVNQENRIKLMLAVAKEQL